MENLSPITRKEHFLAKAAGNQAAKDLDPITREEWFISQIQGGGGGGAVSSVNGKTGAVVLVSSDIGAEPKKLTVIVTESNGTYTGDKTFAQMWTAYHTDHKTVTVEMGDTEFVLSAADPSGMAFTSVSVGSGNATLSTLTVDDNDDWSYTEFAAEQKPAAVTVSGTTPTITPADNTVYNCGELSSLTISNPPATGKYSIVFYSGSTPTATVGIANFAAEADKRYRITVEDGYATYDAWSVGGGE